MPYPVPARSFVIIGWPLAGQPMFLCSYAPT